MDPARLTILVETSAALRRTRSRKEKVAALAACLRAVRPEEIALLVPYLAGRLPQGSIGVGWATLEAASPTAPAPEASLTLAEVDAAFTEIAATTGPGSVAMREARLGALLARATENELAFLRGLLVGELRQGALEGLMIEAVARAADVPAAAVRRAVMLSGEMDRVARDALAGGETALAAYRLRVHRPVQPMLAETADSPEEALGRLGPAAFEDKLDGARIQVHKGEGVVRVFTRSLKEVTESVPEVVALVAGFPADTLVLDGEAITVDGRGRPLPFQITMSRFGKKLDVASHAEALPLVAQFFDCLHAGGRDLLDEDGETRIAALEAAVPRLHRVRRRLVTTSEEGDAFLAEALDAGHEGVMVKSLEAPYAAGRRGKAWLKVKPAHTLDLVVLAAEWGHGRRRGWLSNLHLGARDPATGGFVMLGKTFKGLTDAMLAWQTERLFELETRREGHVVHVRPELVVEIAVNEIQTSPRYPGGMALRFARVKRYREDKRPEEADTVDTVRALHARGPGASFEAADA